jgi:hypothetical protein
MWMASILTIFSILVLVGNGILTPTLPEQMSSSVEGEMGTNADDSLGVCPVLGCLTPAEFEAQWLQQQALAHHVH